MTRVDSLPEADFADGFKGLVFDIDGVMLDSRDSNMEFYNLIRRYVNLPPLSEEEEEYCQMATVTQSLERIIPPEYRLASEEACARISYREQILPLLKLEPGLLEMLQRLRERKVRLGIFTNRSSSVDELLRYFGLEDFFQPVATAALFTPKPSPDGLLAILREWSLAPRQIAFIGDSSVDAVAAEAAGVPFWSFRNQSLQARLHVDGFFRLDSLISPLLESE